MTSTELSIDTARLEKRRETGTITTARCPACALTGGDKRGQHFFYNTADGKFGCAAHKGDTEHRREIFRLVGIKGERQPDPVRERQWREDRRRERERAQARAKLVQTAKERRAAIVAKWRWTDYDVWENSPQRIDQPLVELDPRHFIQSLFAQDAVIWTGELNQTGTWPDGRTFPDHWCAVADWQHAPERTVGPMVSPATWSAGTISRSSDNVLSAPFVVLDFDELDGRKPETPAEIAEHVAASLAITRWLREGLRWQLAAIIHTGNKSIHAWFLNPGTAALQSLRDAAGPFGIDKGLVGNPEHPARLPGQRHAKSGRMSRVLWLQTPATATLNDHASKTQPESK